VSEAGKARREAALAGHVGDTDSARRLFASTEPVVRATALAALDRLGSLDDATLATALRDGAPIVRRRAAQLAARYRAVPLDGALGDIDSRVVEMAAWACGEREQVPDADLALLIELASKHEDALVRESAVAALGAIGDERGLSAILEACSDKPAIRRRAVIALTPFGGPEVAAAFARALEDRDWQVRQLAQELGPE
jgi:HEAT repeat protein